MWSISGTSLTAERALGANATSVSLHSALWDAAYGRPVSGWGEAGFQGSF